MGAGIGLPFGGGIGAGLGRRRRRDTMIAGFNVVSGAAAFSLHSKNIIFAVIVTRRHAGARLYDNRRHAHKRIWT